MSYTKLRYHLVIETKDRLPLITPQVEAKLYPILQKEAIEQRGRLFKINGTQDHVHAVAAIHRSVAVEDFINSLKTSSCEALNNSNLNLAWEEHYGALSLYPYEFGNILKYVANQKFRHRKGWLWPEYEETVRYSYDSEEGVSPYTKLRYHLITGTKYRLPLITPYVEAELYPSWHQIAKENGAILLKVGGVEDHVHTVAAIPPHLSVSDLMRTIKAKSSGKIKKTCLIQHFRWQIGFSGFTLAPFDLTAVKNYVANQKEHHAQNKLWAEFERL